MLKDVILEAKDIWKGYEIENNLCRWVLCGANIEVAKGDFVSILGNKGSGKSVLLKVLSFKESVARGEVYFQGRLVKRNGTNELSAVQDERVLLITETLDEIRSDKLSSQKLAVVLLDEPDDLLDPKKAEESWDLLRNLNQSGVTIIIATCESEIAAQADITYKLVEGKLVKITGMIDCI